jgi:heme-degrading monooxygenase HmoA
LREISPRQTHDISKGVATMVTIGMNYKMLPGKGEVFEKAFANVLEVMKEMEGHSASFLYKDVNDPLSYLIVSDWSSEEAFNGFIQSKKFRDVANWGKENILAGRPTHTVYKQ